jgi:hypothetical protein
MRSPSGAVLAALTLISIPAAAQQQTGTIPQGAAGPTDAERSGNPGVGGSSPSAEQFLKLRPSDARRSVRCG